MLETVRRSLSSLQKGLDILCSFDFATTSLSAQAISERLSLPLSTTYKYIETLLEKGFLVRNPETRNYELGLTLFKLGNIISSRMKMVDIAQPHMKVLSSESGETVLLTVIAGREVVCLEREETSSRIKVSLERGSSLPLHAGASSKVLLAYKEEPFVDLFLKERAPLIRFTDATITDPVRLKSELGLIKKRGFAFSDHEVDSGVRGIGGPIRNHRGDVIAGLSIAGPAERIDDARLPRLIALVTGAADRISGELGYRYDQTGSDGSALHGHSGDAVRARKDAPNRKNSRTKAARGR